MTTSKAEATPKTRKSRNKDSSKQAKAAIEIYGLFDPRVGEIRYIGKAVDSEKRLRGHLRETRRKTPLYSWIEKLRRQGVSPGVRVLAHAITQDWQSLEMLLIEQYRASNVGLLNVADGGDEPYCPAEVRSANGHKLCDEIANNPLMARIVQNKRILSNALRRGSLSEVAKNNMRMSAALCPEIFGDWAAI
jgi:hypothetical protein